MKTIGDLLKRKGKDIWSVAPQQSVYEALELMAKQEIGALLVIEDGKLAGIFSERDYARKIILKGRASKDTSVGELMTRTVLYATPANTLTDCMATMTSKHIRHLPVIDGGSLAGIVTLGDVVKMIIDDQEVTIKDLETYITGDYR